MTPQAETLCKRSDDVAPQAETLCKRSDDVTPQAETLCKRSDDVTPQAGTLCKRSDDVAPQAETLCKRSDDVAPRAETLCKRSDDVAPQAEMLCKRSDDVAPQAETLCKRSDDVAPQAEMLCKRSDDVAPRAATLCKRSDDVAPLAEPPPTSAEAPPLYSAYIWIPVAARKDSRYASSQSGWRTIRWPSDSRVCFQFLRGVPGRSSCSSTDPRPRGAQPVAQPLDARDTPLPERALEDDPRVVLARGLGLERVPAGHARPLAEQVDIARVVHLVDQAGAPRAAGDLAEDGLALRREEPLHVREARRPCRGALSTLPARARRRARASAGTCRAP